MLKHGFVKLSLLSLWQGGHWRVWGRITPCSQDQWERVVPGSGAGMDGFPQAGMMYESMGKAVVGFCHGIVQNLFSFPMH